MTAFFFYYLKFVSNFCLNMFTFEGGGVTNGSNFQSLIVRARLIELAGGTKEWGWGWTYVSEFSDYLICAYRNGNTADVIMENGT